MCSEPLFSYFEPFKIHYFHSHFLASRGQDYFFLISICFDIVFFHGQLGPWTIEQLPIFQMADLPF